MKKGKLPGDLLKKIITKYTGYRREDVLLPGKLGEDCTFIDMDSFTLAVSTDPVTAAEKDIGKIAFNINLNDIATSGAEGIGMMVTLLLPPGTSFERVEEVMGEIHEECLKHRIQILGGHTEVTDSVRRIVVSITVLGKIRKGEEIISTNVKAGDTLLVSKVLGLEGTLIMLNDFEDSIKSLSREEIDELKARLKDTLSVAKEGEIGRLSCVNSMHDVTEGGILGAVYEVIKGSGLGCIIYEEKLPFLPETEKLCRDFNINPLKLISSGSMLFSTNRPEVLREAMKKAGIEVWEIGNATKMDLKLVRLDGSEEDIDSPSRDEIYKLF